MSMPLRSRKGRRIGIALVAAAAVIAALTLAPTTADPRADDQRPRVVATFTVIGDWVRVVGGDHIDLRILAPAGAEVHEWELRPSNFIALEKADLVFANGLGLEQWMGQLAATVPAGIPIIELAAEAGYPTQPIVVGEYEGRPDPHQWMDPRAARRQVGLIAEHLAELDPDHAAEYRDNAARYQQQLDELHAELEQRLGAIPEDRRTLITSEAAFLYLADAYGFFHDGIWGSNAEDEGSPQQIARIIDIVEERRPAALFWESTISDRYVRSVAEDTGTPVAGPLYVDSIARDGSGPGTYLEMMRANADLLVERLAE